MLPHHQEDGNCKLKIQFRPMKSTKGEWEEMEMSEQLDPTLSITVLMLEAEAKGKPWISVFAITQVPSVFFMGKFYTCYNLLLHPKVKVQLQTGKHITQFVQRDAGKHSLALTRWQLGIEWVWSLATFTTHPPGRSVPAPESVTAQEKQFLPSLPLPSAWG